MPLQTAVILHAFASIRSIHLIRGTTPAHSSAPKPSIKPTAYLEATVPNSAPRFLDQIREKILLKHYSTRTKKTHLDSLRRLAPFRGLLCTEGLEAHPANVSLHNMLPASTLAAVPRIRAR